jgi:hypothetical protein
MADGEHPMENATRQAIRQLKRQIRLLERLAGTLIITIGEKVVTVQRADREKQRRQLRNK